MDPLTLALEDAVYEANLSPRAGDLSASRLTAELHRIVRASSHRLWGAVDIVASCGERIVLQCESSQCVLVRGSEGWAVRGLDVPLSGPVASALTTFLTVRGRASPR
ncbi:MAG: hypothetical protein AB7P00_40235 [Sandaracinaceae bacterium]